MVVRIFALLGLLDFIFGRDPTFRVLQVNQIQTHAQPEDEFSFS